MGSRQQVWRVTYDLSMLVWVLMPMLMAPAGVSCLLEVPGIATDSSAVHPQSCHALSRSTCLAGLQQCTCLSATPTRPHAVYADMVQIPTIWLQQQYSRWDALGPDGDPCHSLLQAQAQLCYRPFRQQVAGRGQVSIRLQHHDTASKKTLQY